MVKHKEGVLTTKKKPNPRTTAIMAIAAAHGIQLDIVQATPGHKDNFKKLLEINPLGQIPTFVGNDGWVLSECIPIALYSTYHPKLPMQAWQMGTDSDTTFSHRPE